MVFALMFMSLSLASCNTQENGLPTPTATVLDSAQSALVEGDQEAGRKAYDQAIEDYTQAIQLNPNFAEAYNNRGLAYALKSKNQMQYAIADYSQAILLRPAYAFAYNNRGVAYMASGHPEEALSDFNHAIQIDPSFSQAHSNRGNYYWRAGRYDLAFIDLIQANLLLVGAAILLFILIGGMLFFLRRKITQH